MNRGTNLTYSLSLIELFVIKKKKTLFKAMTTYSELTDYTMVIIGKQPFVRGRVGNVLAMSLVLQASIGYGILLSPGGARLFARKLETFTNFKFVLFTINNELFNYKLIWLFY